MVDRFSKMVVHIQRKLAVVYNDVSSHVSIHFLINRSSFNSRRKLISNTDRRAEEGDSLSFSRRYTGAARNWWVLIFDEYVKQSSFFRYRHSQWGSRSISESGASRTMDTRRRIDCTVDNNDNRSWRKSDCRMSCSISIISRHWTRCQVSFVISIKDCFDLLFIDTLHSLCIHQPKTLCATYFMSNRRRVRWQKRLKQRANYAIKRCSMRIRRAVVADDYRWRTERYIITNFDESHEIGLTNFFSEWMGRFVSRCIRQCSWTSRLSMSKSNVDFHFLVSYRHNHWSHLS